MIETTNLATRVTSLERYGMRGAQDFQPESLQFIRDAGYTGVFVNGGSGIGPDMMPPESLIESRVLPDLMPLTVRGNRREMERRSRLIREAALNSWLCVWGVPGPDESGHSLAAESNRFYDRRSKLEMSAKLHRTPDLFGQRNQEALSWRGSRPLCVSHPLVQEFYRDLYTRLPLEYPEIEGVFFFPGDAGPELCSECCPRCRSTGLDPWGVMIRHVNDIYGALRSARPGFKFFFTFWDMPETIHRCLNELDPGIGICMSQSDYVVQTRKSGRMFFNQPWSNVAEPGGLFLETAAQAFAQGRPVMSLGEISQSEVWDPVCHNVPLPVKTLQLLKSADEIPGVNAICDFWGNRAPFLPHANHAAMRAYFQNQNAAPEELLRRAAMDHYLLCEHQPELTEQALDCWKSFDQVVDDWALTGWGQRFSFAIGRDAARGRLYKALVPPCLKNLHEEWGVSQLLNNGISATDFAKWQQEDCDAFLAVAGKFERLAGALKSAGGGSASRWALRESQNIELAGELIASEGRTILALDAYRARDAAVLRSTIAGEIDARERQLEISGRLGWGGGVNPILVSEDIQNMRLFLSSDDFPNTDDELFHFTATPYSV
jgi:hypothetical protein